MSPPLLGVEGDETGNISLMTSTSSMESIYQNSSEPMERNYLGLQDCSSVDSSDVSKLSEVNKNNLNLKATELRLGLPGSQSPEKTLFPLLPSKDGICLSSQRTVISGNKRGLLDTQERSHAINGTSLIKANGSNPHADKAQVVGWPPVRSFRKNIVATSSRNNNEADEKTGPSAMFVKVSMDGAPYLRKVDLRSYSTYQQLSSALEKLFSCFTMGQCGSQGASGRERLSESKLRDLLNGSEYVVTYEDKDGDWMLVGDVPWDMFIGSCKRLKIMKGSDAIGLAPRPK